MNEKMFEPRPKGKLESKEAVKLEESRSGKRLAQEKAARSKVAPAHLLEMLKEAPESKLEAEKIVDAIPETEVVPEESDIPTMFEPDSKSDWAWGQFVPPLRQQDLEKAMPEEAATETKRDLPRFEEEYEGGEGGVTAEAKSERLADAPQGETLRSADEEAVSGIREKIVSDFSARGTAAMSPEVIASESYEMEERPEGFITKEVPNYEISAMGKLPTTGVSAPPEMPSELEPEEGGTLKAA